MNIDISADHLNIVQSILRQHLPHNASIWVFGSRAKGTARKYSDLDLAIDMGGNPMPSHLSVLLSYDFEESDLPYKVDILDLNAVNPDFRRRIEMERVPFPFA